MCYAGIIKLILWKFQALKFMWQYTLSWSGRDFIDKIKKKNLFPDENKSKFCLKTTVIEKQNTFSHL